MADHMIKDTFTNNIPIKVTPQLANAVIKLVQNYETKGTHPEAFNSPYLGLYPCYFLTKDRDDFFSLFDSSFDEVNQLIVNATTGSNRNAAVFGIKSRALLEPILKYARDFFNNRGFTNESNLSKSDIKNAMKDITSINLNYKVASDPFNLFSIYVVYIFLSSNLPEKLKREAAFSVLMFLQYKFFTSLVNHRFKYKPSLEAMQATFEAISGRFDIKTYGTWKEVLRARASDFLDKHSVHYKTLCVLEPDTKVLYVVTDLQTRIRNQINLFTEEFMRIKETQDRIGGYSLQGTDPDGNATIVDISDHFDAMVSGVYQDAMSISHFLDDTLIRLIVKFFTSLNQTNFRSVLISFSEYAVKQARSGQQLSTEKINGESVNVGAYVLINSIIQKTYRYLNLNNVNIRNVGALLKATKEVYGSSRIADEGIVEVRRSVSYLLTKIQSSTREATLTALRSAFVIYIIMLSFKYLKK